VAGGLRAHRYRHKRRRGADTRAHSVSVAAGLAAARDARAALAVALLDLERTLVPLLVACVHRFPAACVGSRGRARLARDTVFSEETPTRCMPSPCCGAAGDAGSARRLGSPAAPGAVASRSTSHAPEACPTPRFPSGALEALDVSFSHLGSRRFPGLLPAAAENGWVASTKIQTSAEPRWKQPTANTAHTMAVAGARPRRSRPGLDPYLPAAGTVFDLEWTRLD